MTFVALNVVTVSAQNPGAHCLEEDKPKKISKCYRKALLEHKPELKPFGCGKKKNGWDEVARGNCLRDLLDGQQGGATTDDAVAAADPTLAACFVKENQAPNMMECGASLFSGFSEKECVIRICTEGYDMVAPDDSWKGHVEAFDVAVGN